MKLDSKFFDRLRVKPDASRLMRDACPACERQGCAKPGLYPAPKGRGHEGEYHRFCLEHVRDYNKSYNYFSGMPDDDVAKHQKDDLVGHRPTWFVGVNSAARNRAVRSGERRNGFAHRFSTLDPFGLFGAKAAPAGPGQQAESARPVRRAERKCLRLLNLEDSATKAEIKTRFKDLVKRHHPDRNGGDRTSEDKLREVIQAYNYLRQAGLA